MSLTKEQIEFLQWKAKGEHPFTKLEIESQDIRDLCDMALRSLKSAPSATGAQLPHYDYDESGNHQLVPTPPTGDSVRVPETWGDALLAVDRDLALERIKGIRACLDDGTYTKQERKDIGWLCDAAMLAAAPVAATGAQVVGALTRLRGVLVMLEKVPFSSDLRTRIFPENLMQETIAAIEGMVNAAPQPVASAPEEKSIRERCEKAESIILLLTADHNTGPYYVKGFEAARQHFSDYPESGLRMNRGST